MDNSHHDLFYVIFPFSSCLFKKQSRFTLVLRSRYTLRVVALLLILILILLLDLHTNLNILSSFFSPKIFIFTRRIFFLILIFYKKEFFFTKYALNLSKFIYYNGYSIVIFLCFLIIWTK